MRFLFRPRAESRSQVRSVVPASQATQRVHPAAAGASAGMPIFLQRMTARPTLKVDPATAPFEQEADRISAAVESRDGSPLARFHRAYSTGAIAEPSLAASLFRESLSQSKRAGDSIPKAVREPIEEKLGADFSGVRVHSD